jgi:hypothetical protein
MTEAVVEDEHGAVRSSGPDRDQVEEFLRLLKVLLQYGREPGKDPAAIAQSNAPEGPAVFGAA